MQTANFLILIAGPSLISRNANHDLLLPLRNCGPTTNNVADGNLSWFHPTKQNRRQPDEGGP